MRDTSKEDPVMMVGELERKVEDLLHRLEAIKDSL